MKLTKRQLKLIIREEYARLKRDGLILETLHPLSSSVKSKDPNLLTDREHQALEEYMPVYREKLLKGIARLWKEEMNLPFKADKMDEMGFFWPEKPWRVLDIV